MMTVMREHKSTSESPLLTNLSSPHNHNYQKEDHNIKAALCFFLAFLSLTIVGLIYGGDLSCWLLRSGNRYDDRIEHKNAHIVESEHGVVAADDARCSEIGASMLRRGGHAVDAAVATALCCGVVNPESSGIGGGAFMVVRSSSTLKSQAFDMRETAPLAASMDMYAHSLHDLYEGPSSIGVPGEIAGLHEAWMQHGRLAWRTLFKPAIKLARDGFVVAPFLGSSIAKGEGRILNDPGLMKVFAPEGKLLQAGDRCYNVELARTLETIAEQGPQAFYNGPVGEKLVKDVRNAGGILSMEGLKNYHVKVTDAMSVDIMGYTVHGMPLPSSGTLGMALVLNILESFESSDAVNTNLTLHRMLEAVKHMHDLQENLGDPDFVDVANYTSKMVSKSYARKVGEMIQDDITPSIDLLMIWPQLRNHGTSHFCIVDAERNAVSMTTTVNSGFGAGFLSPSTGILLNNEMSDFSTPFLISLDTLAPAQANSIEPNKRPLSSMTPIIVTKDGELAGVLGGSGGMMIIPALVQVFLNHFGFGMDPLPAVQRPRVYHRGIPNIVHYENWTVIDGEHIELALENKRFLRARGHELDGKATGAIVQLVVQRLEQNAGRKVVRNGENAPVFHGVLTAVSDPRKDGKPASA